MTDILTYKNEAGQVAYELERIPDGDSDFGEFYLRIHFTGETEIVPLEIELSFEDVEILQRVVNDALNNRV